MNAQEFKENYMSEDDYWEVYDPEGYPPCKLVHDGKAEACGKIVYQSSVYQVGEQYFEVTSMRDNCGYWGDGVHHEPEVQEVTPVKKVVEITEWVPADVGVLA